MYILAFVVLLGVLTSFIYISGGLLAFSDWAITKVRTRFQAQLVPYVLGSSSPSTTLSAVWWAET
jgi:tetracycline resistance efflux pump